MFKHILSTIASMKLGLDFIFFSLMILAFVLPLYIYKGRVFTLLGLKSDNFQGFLESMKHYLQQTTPYIKYDFSIIDRLHSEPNTLTKELQIIENMCDQFIESTYVKSPSTLGRNFFWASYIPNSKPIRDRLPNDWQQRKEILFTIEDGKCQRCGRKITPNDSYLNIRKPIAKGGGYNIENLILSCSDCNIVLNYKQQPNIRNRLDMYDFLLASTSK